MPKHPPPDPFTTHHERFLQAVLASPLETERDHWRWAWLVEAILLALWADARPTVHRLSLALKRHGLFLGPLDPLGTGAVGFSIASDGFTLGPDGRDEPGSDDFAFKRHPSADTVRRVHAFYVDVLKRVFSGEPVLPSVRGLFKTRNPRPNLTLVLWTYLVTLGALRDVRPRRAVRNPAIRGEEVKASLARVLPEVARVLGGRVEIPDETLHEWGKRTPRDIALRVAAHIFQRTPARLRDLLTEAWKAYHELRPFSRSGMRLWEPARGLVATPIPYFFVRVK